MSPISLRGVVSTRLRNVSVDFSDPGEPIIASILQADKVHGEALPCGETTMRIIGGQWRSRQLERPGTQRTRPMPDRVKEAIFSILGAQYGTLGSMPQISVADVFAGSGSMGLEALSRGARACVFFERDRTALVALRGNIAALNAGEGASVITADAWAAAPEVHGRSPFDLILLDPPYRDAEDTSPSGNVRQFLSALAARRPVVSPGADPTLLDSLLVVLHHPAGTEYQTAPGDPWRIIDTRMIGTNRVTMFSHEPS